MVKLSFIIPCYNVEEYIGQCLDSVLCCGLPETDYEIICVNDCSPDGVSEVLHKYADICRNIQVIDLQSNLGFGAVRNFALEHASGKYVWFVDSDDLIISSSVKLLINDAVNNDLDIIAFNFKDVDENSNVFREQKLFYDSDVVDGMKFVKDILGRHLLSNLGFVWRFIYRINFLKENNIFFPEGVCWEDTKYVPESLILAKRIKSTSVVGYLYRHRSSSACGTFKRMYSGKLIYDYSFSAGLDLVRLSSMISDNKLSEEMYNFALKRYINYFPIYLCRTKRKERLSFFRLIKTNKKTVNIAKTHMSFISKLMVNTCFGGFFIEFFAILYKLTHIMR